MVDTRRVLIQLVLSHDRLISRIDELENMITGVRQAQLELMDMLREADELREDDAPYGPLTFEDLEARDGAPTVGGFMRGIRDEIKVTGGGPESLARFNNPRYEIPGAPPVGTKLKDRFGNIHQRSIDGTFVVIELEDDPEPFVGLGEIHLWLSLLNDFGPLDVVPLTEEDMEIERLYGPFGQRWGNPDEPCPYIYPVNPNWVCSLGVGHIGQHKTREGVFMSSWEPGDPEGPPTAAEVTKEDLETLCTCGRPAQHRPTCPRYKRMESGIVTPQGELGDRCA